MFMGWDSGLRWVAHWFHYITYIYLQIYVYTMIKILGRLSNSHCNSVKILARHNILEKEMSTEISSQCVFIFWDHRRRHEEKDESTHCPFYKQVRYLPRSQNLLPPPSPLIWTCYETWIQMLVISIWATSLSSRPNNYLHGSLSPVGTELFCKMIRYSELETWTCLHTNSVL